MIAPWARQAPLPGPRPNAAPCRPARARLGTPHVSGSARRPHWRGVRFPPGAALAVRSALAVGLAAAAAAALTVAAVAAAVSLPAAASAAPLKLEDYEVAPQSLGGDFSLTNQRGKPATLQQLRGKVVAVFFGYTYCPDVCPTTLADLARVKKLLGRDGARVVPVFITVDPARDTPARLAAYLANFGKDFLGLTGSEERIREVAKRYNARYARGADQPAGGYLMDHTGFLYLLDGTGKVRYLFTFDAGTEVVAAGARRLLKG